MKSSDPTARNRWPRAVIGASVALGALLFALSRWPGFLDAYCLYIGPWIGIVLARVSGLVPWSLATLLLLVALAGGVAMLARGGYRVLRGRATLASALGVLLRRTASATLPLLVLFYGLWGIHYARPALSVELGWPEVGSLTQDEEARRLLLGDLQALAFSLTHEVNELRAGLAGQTEALRLPAREDLDRAIDEALGLLALRLPLSASARRSRGPAKPALLPGLLSRLGLGGFYFPFTGEATYNGQVPPWQIPLTIAHEKAHQRGYADETEANFLGFLACASSPDAFVRYSGLLFAQRHLMGRLAYANSLAYRDILRQLSPAVESDRRQAVEFWRSQQGWLTTVSRTTNDLYLKLHRVPGGVLAYGRFDRLMVLARRAGIDPVGGVRSAR